MKRYIAIVSLLAGLIFPCLMVQAQTFSLRMVRDSVGGGYLYARIQIKSDTSFKVGTSALFFDYNENTLGKPELVQPFNYTGFMSGPPCLSGFCVYNPDLQHDNTDARTGVGINLAFVNSGAHVPVSYTDVVQIRFPIINALGDVNVAWRDTWCGGEFLAPTVVKLDDDETSLCAGDLLGMNGRPEPDCGKDGYEPNDDLPLAANLYGGAILGFDNMRICPRFDEDWFYFTVNIPGVTIKVDLQSLPGDYNIELHDTDGIVASSTNTGTQDDQISYAGAMAGTYYIRVYGFEGAWSSTDAYMLTLNMAMPPPPGGVGVKPSITAPIFKSDGPQSYLKVYPNPAHAMLHTEFLSSGEGRSTLKMTDAYGRLVLKQDWDMEKGVNSISLDIKGFAEGIYFVILEHPDGKWEEKVMVIEQ